MKNPKKVFQELGDLYEFYQQIQKFTIKNKEISNNSLHGKEDSVTPKLKPNRQ
jgi:hypothetical protein